MKKKLLCLTISALLLLTALLTALPFPAAAADIVMEPYFGQPFQPAGTTFGQVSFLVPSDAAGLTKDAWDGNIDHNTDLILISYIKNGVTYENKTLREVKAQLGNKALMRTCYTYEGGPDGSIRLNLVFHMDDHAALKPADILAVTVKAGFVWCAGSPSGITSELTSIRLDRDVSFVTNATVGITGVQTGPMPGPDGALRIKFDRAESDVSLKAISTVNLCPSAIPGKTLGDLVTINGETVTALVEQGKVARFNFYGDTLVVHIDDEAYLRALKSEPYPIVILPGFRWMTWDQDDWGNWAGTNADKYTPVEGSLVLEPISFCVNAKDEIAIPSDSITVEPGYRDTYTVGESFDMKTLLIRVHRTNGKSEVMPILERMVSYDFSKPGKATVTIDYDGMQTSFTVTVKEAPATEPVTEMTTEPATEMTTEPSTETSVETAAIPETASDVPPTDATASATDTDTDSESGAAVESGCGSSVVLLPTLLPLLTLAVSLRRKKKED